MEVGVQEHLQIQTFVLRQTALDIKQEEGGLKNDTMWSGTAMINE